jgi:pimeloyl-ACP methyl ester carboxylesterase
MVTRHAVDATRGYYGGGAGMRSVGWLMRATHGVWPAVGQSLAMRLFCLPLPFKWQQRRRALAGWRTEQWAFERRSITLYAPERPGQPQAPVVVLAHGWGGHARQMLPLASTLAAAGWVPRIIEMPAHGRSGGLNSSLPQFARALDYVVSRLRERGEPVHALVGHSLGANAAAYAESRGLAVPRLVLLAPPASPRHYTRLFAQAFGLGEALRAGLQRRVEAREGIVMPQFEPGAVGPRIGSRTLVVHDRQDRINAFADGEAFGAAIAGAQLLATDGLGHRGVLKDDTVLRSIGEFLSR